MRDRRKAASGMANNLWPLLAFLPATVFAQVPVDEDGEVIGAYEPAASMTDGEEIPLLSDTDLEALVGPIALYPDDLLAIVLPASAYPLQIIEAARFLENLESDPSLKPDPEWDDSVVALINYPEVVELLNEDIDWTWRLGEAVVAQQGEVVAAIESFRDRAYAAGNLKSDGYQRVTRDEGIIEITPVDDDVIYVPYYEPERVVVYQPRPVYYYYPRAYPVYYYPYSSAHAFDRGFFWGVTTAFTIGWYTDSLNVYHHSYHGHPYYGHRYWNRWWYRRPTINVYNTTYVRARSPVTINRYYGGDRWRPRHDRRDYVSSTHVTRTRHITRTPRADSTVRRSDSTRRRDGVVRNRSNARGNDARRLAASERNEPITFRARPRSGSAAPDRATTRNNRQVARHQPSTTTTPKARSSNRARVVNRDVDTTPQRSSARARYRPATPAPRERRRESNVDRRESRRVEAPRQSAPRERRREANVDRRESRHVEAPRQSAPREERRRETRSGSRRAAESKAPAARQGKERRSSGQRNKERRQRR